MDVAKELARRIEDGDYSPSPLQGCDPLIPLDEHPHVVRFSQLFFFPYKRADVKPHGKETPAFVVVTGQHAGGHAADRDTLKKLWDELLSSQSITSAYLKGQLPHSNTKKKKAQAKLRANSKILKENEFPAPSDEDDALLVYSEWLPSALKKELGRLRQALAALGCRSLPGLPESLTPGAIQDWLAKVFEECFPGAFDDPGGASLRERQPILALCVECEQLWTAKGHTRGDLLNSFSLAPGEQLTLEIHSWDKSSRKSESELASESELRVSSKLTARDNQQVVMELATEMGGKLSANGGLTIPIPAGDVPLPVDVNASGELQGRLLSSIKNTVDRTTERTLEAASTIKNTRRLKVEISREVGREEKQTRVIANTNRCHALNAHYFEVMANYVVSTRPMSVRPCILLPCPLFKPADRKWVLAHENLLMQALLDPVFVPGFGAAKMLEADAKLEELKKKRAAAQAAEVSSTPAATDELTAEFDRKRQAICDAYGKLQTAKSRVVEAMESTESSALLGAGVYFAAVVAKLAAQWGADQAVLYLRQMLYLAVLQATPNAINALDALSTSRSGNSMKPSREALRNFYAALNPRDFELNPVAASVANGLVALGVPETLVDAVIDGGLLAYSDDDAGLYLAIKAAYDRLKKAEEGLVVTDLGAGLTAEEAPQAAPPIEEGYSLLDLAEADVEFQRLSDHLQDNREHYQQAMWLRTHPDVRQRHLHAQGSIASLVTNEIMGFHGDKAAYPIADLSLLGTEAPYYAGQLEQAMKSVSENLEALATEPFLVTQPTQGTVMEVTLGACDACEDYIQHSRLIDLREREARAQQEEAEADRRRRRIEGSPPELGEFSSLPRGRLSVNLESCTQESTGEDT